MKIQMERKASGYDLTYEYEAPSHMSCWKGKLPMHATYFAKREAMVERRETRGEGREAKGERREATSERSEAKHEARGEGRGAKSER